MGEEDRRRKRVIDTPMGGVGISENMWNEGEEDEHWAYVQGLSKYFDEDTRNGEVLGHFLEQYAVARTLILEGYEIHSYLDDENILWVKYTQ